MIVNPIVIDMDVGTPTQIPMSVESTQTTIGMGFDEAINVVVRGRVQEKEVTPTEEVQSILPDEDYDALSKEGIRVTVGRLRTFNSFFAWKREQIEMQQNIILQMKAEKQKKLKILMDVMSYLKSIEQLKERRWQEYQAEALQEEQKMLDEIGLQLTMRRKREGVSS